MIMTILNGVKLRGNETFKELLEIGKKKNCPNIKNSCTSDSYAFKGRTSLICKAKICNNVLRPDYLSRIDKRYCQDCLQ